MLKGRFLVEVPMTKSETSNLLASASSGASSSIGFKSRLRDRILELGVVSAC